jgi:hypothetical protein
MLWPFGIFVSIFSILVCCTKKNLATLLDSENEDTKMKKVQNVNFAAASF